MQRVVPTAYNDSLCRVSLSISFVFIGANLALWTTISVYRLYLVVSSAYAAPKRMLLRSRAVAVRALPLIGLTVGAATGIVNGIWADPIIIFRDCRGLCDAYDPTKTYWSITFMMVFVCVYQIPSCVCYLVMYCFLKRQQVK